MLTRFSRRPRKTVFFHVMKTGGMTFRGILSSLYGTSFHVCDDPSLGAVETALAKFDCVEFHIQPWKNEWVHLHGEVASQKRWDLLDGMDIFTMFRDPVDQILSQYFFMVKIRASVEPIMRASGIAFPESMEEFLDHRSYFNNQVAFMVGKSQTAGACPGPGDLAEAQQVIERLRMHVGVTDQFADSMQVFQSVTGRRISAADIRIQNRNLQRPPSGSISESIKQRIREQSYLDMELYTFGREIFQEDFSRCRPSRRYSFLGLRIPELLQAQFEFMPKTQ